MNHTVVKKYLRTNDICSFFLIIIIIIIIIHYIYIALYIALFSALKALYIERGISSTTTSEQHPPG